MSFPREVDMSVVLTVILVAALFAAGSWLIPYTYFSTAPHDHFIEIRSVDVNQTSQSDFDADVYYQTTRPLPAIAEIQLLTAEGNGTDKVIKSWKFSGYLEEGESTADLTLTTDEPLPPGLYYLHFNVEYRPGYNVERTYTYESDGFAVTDYS